MSLFAPPLACAFAIFMLSHQPRLPAAPGGDKFAHLVAYFVLGALTLRALYLGTAASLRRAVVLAAIAASLYGVSDEFHQMFVPGRDASGLDLIADAVGAVGASVVGFAYYRWRPRRG